MSIATRHAVRAGALSLGLALVVGITSTHLDAQNARPPQRLDTAYTAKIKEHLQDPRITTELVDHLPASDTVPTPLAFHGRIVGTPGELTYAKDIHRYFEALDKASDRATLWTHRQDRRGPRHGAARDCRRGDDQAAGEYRDKLAQLTDPRKTTEAQAQQLLKTAKPIYWLTSGMHSPENGGPEMLQELAYRLIVAGDAVRPADSRQRHHVHHAGHRGRRPREAGRHLLLQQEAPAGSAPAADVLGQVRRARQQPRRHGAVPRADPAP